MISARSIPAIALLLIGSALQLGMARGRSARVYMCTETLERFQLEARHAVSALKPWYEIKGSMRSRKVASKTERGKGQEMMPPDRESWSDWATDRLEDTQRHMDALKTDVSLYREGIQKLSGVATHLVEFHGYAEKGNARKMVLTLNQIILDHEVATKQICSQLKSETNVNDTTN